jgi:hypothetical protein
MRRVRRNAGRGFLCRIRPWQTPGSQRSSNNKGRKQHPSTRTPQQSRLKRHLPLRPQLPAAQRRTKKPLPHRTLCRNTRPILSPRRIHQHTRPRHRKNRRIQPAKTRPQTRKSRNRTTTHRPPQRLSPKRTRAQTLRKTNHHTLPPQPQNIQMQPNTAHAHRTRHL